MGGKFVHPPVKPNFRDVYMEGGRSYHQEDPRRQIILAPYVFCFHFTCKGMYWIFLAER